MHGLQRNARSCSGRHRTRCHLSGLASSVVLAPAIHGAQKRSIGDDYGVSPCRQVCSKHATARHVRRVQAAAVYSESSAPELDPDAEQEDEAPTSLTEDVPYGKGRRPRDQKMTGPEVLERAGPEHPYPAMFQQTLVSSFTLAGVGVHSGEFACVRVRPAFAEEGRYFVHVPEGTNTDRMEGYEPVEVNLEEGGQMPMDPGLEERKLQVFKEYLIAQEDEGFNGTFKQFLQHVDAEDLLERWDAGEDVSKGEFEFAPPEEIQARGEDEGVTAHVDNIHIPAAVTVTLGDLKSEETTVVGAELLLAALEACGVDNARIEIEGGIEIPQLDGSALGWGLEIQFAGVRPAPRADGQEDYVPREAVLYSGGPFIVTEGDSYVSFVPENNMRITCGLDHHLVSESIGKQWFSWSIFEDLPFRFCLAGARRWLAHYHQLQMMGLYGCYQGMTEGTVMIAKEDTWLRPELLRYPHDEAARHEVMVTIGLMAMNAKKGHAGLPFGHITTYKASPELRLKFIQELRSRITDESWVPVWDVPLNVDPLEHQVEALMEFNRIRTEAVLRETTGDPDFELPRPDLGDETWQDDEDDKGASEQAGDQTSTVQETPGEDQQSTEPGH